MWSHRHLLGTDQLTPEDAALVLDRADAIGRAWADPKGEKKSSALRGRTVINLFFEASTRTRTSFEIAGKRLGADVVNVSGSARRASPRARRCSTPRRTSRRCSPT